MSAKTSIEWTDRTWNPVTGCTKVSPGCAHCYAEGVADRFWATQYPWVFTGEDSVPGPHGSRTRPRQFTDVQTHEDRLLEPLSWRKPARVFVNSMSDLFHEDVPDTFIDDIFAVMTLCTRHTFQVLTKRPERMRHYLTESIDEEGRLARQRIGLRALGLCLDHYPKRISDGGSTLLATHGREGEVANWPRKNVWLGVSVENQHFADERIPLLLQTPAAVRFVSCEPLLGPVNLKPGQWMPPMGGGPKCNIYGLPIPPDLDWVIVGGESGPQARPMVLGWARSLVAQCQAADVPVFVKQLGAMPMVSEESWAATGPRVHLLNHRNNRRVPAGFVPLKFMDRKGGEIAEWPEDLRVRQFPEAR